MIKCAGLTLNAIAIGSLPHTDINKAFDIVKRDFKEIPFWPQLTKLSKNEDMIFQFTENMPSFFYDKNYFIYDKTAVDNFLNDFENIQNNPDLLDKYKISQNYSRAFPYFIEFVKDIKPDFAKGQVTGAFTLATNLKDSEGNLAIYNPILKEIISKTMVLKALWQIKEIKSASPDTKPIIFIDEPSLHYTETRFSDIKKQDIIDMIKFVSDAIKCAGALSGLHCCGECDWLLPIMADVDIINPNVYTYKDTFELPCEELKEFFKKGKKIAWSIVPTQHRRFLKRVTKEDLISNFERGVNYLTKNGIDEKIIIENSLITSSCGTGGLSEELAEKAMRLTREISDDRKAIWHLN